MLYFRQMFIKQKLMNLIRLISPFLTIGLLSSVALFGCQSTSLNSTGFTNPTVDNENWSASTPKPRLFQTITKYEWQLTHVIDENSQIQTFNHKPPFIMDVHPNFLTFTDSCQRYRVSFDMWLPLPYPYAQVNVRDLSSDCTSSNDSNLKNLSNKNIIKDNTRHVLNSVFMPYSDTAFRFDPLLPKSAQLSNKTVKQLALKTREAKTLIFSGTLKPEHPVTGIPLTNELLERYQWQLIHVADKKGVIMSEFTQVEKPITLSYRLDSYEKHDLEEQYNFQPGVYGQSLGVSVGCNGVSGPYALSVNQTLITGSFPSTMVSCGKVIDDIESQMARLMLYSTSQLTLTHADNAPTATTDESKPNYLLTQKLDTGETLIWKNEVKKTP